MKYTHRLTAIAVAALLATALAGCDNKKEQSKTFNRAGRRRRAQLYLLL
ncbi:Uncharacterised protein [Raoultella terrigena]|uniref:Uncharacterized protein n=1 Tax=Raoultella terrigena TaxID=577 RepID=A0A4U9D3P6_RAOTE|nr:Uncharacterised protein [Raoultella terrigena]